MMSVVEVNIVNESLSIVLGVITLEIYTWIILCPSSVDGKRFLFLRKMIFSSWQWHRLTCTGTVLTDAKKNISCQSTEYI